MKGRMVFGLECRVGAHSGPFFSSKILNSQWHCDNTVYPFNAQLKEDETDKACFQQDGTTAHTAHMSIALLDDMLRTKSFLQPFGLHDIRIFLRQIFFSGVQ
jgi:hypothetical protein